MSRSLSRRAALESLGRLVPASTLMTLGSCKMDPPPPEVRIPMSQLPRGARLVVSLGDVPVEVRHGEEGLIARSLLCTHFGCRVAWDEGSRQYLCACHGGRFDEAGRPVAGPVQRPLREIPLVVVGDVVELGPA